MLIDFIIRKVVSLQYIYLFTDLLCHLFDSIFICPRGNGLFMYSFNGRCRNIQAFYIYLATGEYSRHLIQQTGEILRMNDNCI